jgi:hypothetical protein
MGYIIELVKVKVEWCICMNVNEAHLNDELGQIRARGESGKLYYRRRRRRGEAGKA